MDSKYFDEYFSRGWTVIPNVFDKKIIETVLEEYESVKHVFLFHQGIKGIADQSKNASHHTHLLVPSMLKLIDNDVFHSAVENIFGGNSILNTMGLSEVTSEGVYTQNIHRDVRTNTGDYPLWLNTLIMLDDSNLDNGATWMMEGSQNLSLVPSEKEFFSQSVQACGNKGDLLIFNCNLWHCAGENKTDKARRIITPFFSRPYIKQQLDLPSAYGEGFGDFVSKRIKQWMGYNSRVPKSLGEFYQAKEDRFYKSDQG